MTDLNTEGRGWMSIPLVGVAATTGGAIASVANPEGVTLLITRAIVYCATNSTGAANLTVGVGATATTAATDIMTALALAAAAGLAYNGLTIITATATLLNSAAMWTATTFVTAQGSATTAGFTGTLFIEYIRVA